MSATVRSFHEKLLDLLEDYFGPHYERMKKKGQSVLDAAREALKIYDDTLAESVFESLIQELESLNWDRVNTYLRQQGGVKALLEGPGLAPSLNDFRRLSLYADSVILSGSTLYGKKSVYRQWKPPTRIFSLLGSALGVLEIKDLLLADISPPICVLAEPTVFGSEYVKTFEEITENDVLKLGSEIFEKEFSSDDEIQRFFSSYKDLDSLCAAIKNPGLLYGSRSVFKDEMKHAMTTWLLAMPHVYSTLTDPSLLGHAFQSNSGLARVNSQLFSCGLLDAEPIAPHTAHWRRLMWKFHNDNKLLAKKLQPTYIGEASKDAMIMNVLQLDDFRWLGNVPLDKIIRMREEGVLQDLRDILAKNIQDLKNVSDEDFVDVARQVRYNLDQAFKKHTAEVKSLSQRYSRRFGFGIVSSMVSGTVAAFSAIFAPDPVVLGITAAIGGGTVIGTYRELLKVREEMEELKRRPIAMLFDARKPESDSSPCKPLS